MLTTKIQLSLLLMLLQCSIVLQLSAQNRFDLNKLNSPQKNGASIAEKLETVEVFEYQTPDDNCVMLNNGFNKHGFSNDGDWLKIKDSVEVTKVDIVFSKYPVRNGVYNEIYPLLFRRIISTIEMDPKLNSESIVWRRVWQTHCENRDQANKLFHGVVIWYKKPIQKEKSVFVPEKSKPEKIKEQIISKESQKEESPMSPVLSYMLNHPTTPESLRQTASELKTEEAEALVLAYYREEAKSGGEGPITDPSIQLNYMYELEAFSRQFPENDTVVGRVLDRHPEWKKKIIVNDWTGSMYGYGSQVLLWHLMNLDSSGITNITLFNDGNGKTTRRKKIGRTGGIYTGEANNPGELLALFDKVMQKGGGGDGPENDIEAILKATKKQPDAEIILIADNTACVRDISLAHEINRPVRVILCGYDPEIGVNPDYVYLAHITNGGIYTLEEDLEQMQAAFNDSGELQSFHDERFTLSSPQCFEDVFNTMDGRVFNLSNARRNKKDIRVLDASNARLKEIPSYVFKMEKLQSLELRNNAITEIPEKMNRLNRLGLIDLGRNNLSKLPEFNWYHPYLQYAYIDSNNLSKLPSGWNSLDFIRVIDASYNKITAVDTFDAPVLEELNLAGNSLTLFPNVSQCNNLEKLNLSENGLKNIENVNLPGRLKELDLSNNELTHLPDDLSGFLHLKKLNLQSNPISKGERIRIRQALFYVDLTF